MSDNLLAEMQRDLSKDPGNSSLERSLSITKARQGIKERIVLVWVRERSDNNRIVEAFSSGSLNGARLGPIRDVSPQDFGLCPVRMWIDPINDKYRPLINEEIELLKRQREPK